MKYLTAVVLFFIFAAASIAAPAFALIALALFQTRYAGNLVHAMDMTAAAILGWNGRSTVSKECGRQLTSGQRPCRFCRIVCKLLDRFLERGHCQKEAAK